jgi:hypothetical protein
MLYVSLLYLKYSFYVVVIGFIPVRFAVYIKSSVFLYFLCVLFLITYTVVSFLFVYSVRTTATG